MSKGLYVQGKWLTGLGESFTSRNPADGEVLWQGCSADTPQVGSAFQAARSAFPLWAETPFEKRIEIIKRYKSILESRHEVLARLIAQETGKPYWDAESEAKAMIGKVEISIQAYYDRTGSKAMEIKFGQLTLEHKPHGIMVVLGPYNFPAHLPNGHIIPALLAGNTLIFKPSEITPAVGEFMVTMWDQAGLPKGVLNLVQGGRDVGKALLSHQEVDGVLFTGSVEVGCAIHKYFGGRPEVILALEMGGNNPLIVWDVSDYKAAANLVVQSAYISAGQRCSCARRLIVPDNEQGDKLIKSILDLLDVVRIGIWDLEPQPFMGPVVSEQAAQNVLRGQQDLVAKGAEILRPVRTLETSECFLTPGLIDVTQSGFMDYEIFGPLLQFIRVPNFSRAIEISNHTHFGLSAGLFSDREDLWKLFKQKIRAGVVNWNRPTTGAASSLPFGGVGRSGNHRPSAYYAADYCAYPISSQEASRVESIKMPGL